MRKLFGLALLALFLVVGCGKKTEPEAVVSPAIDTDLTRLVIIRKNSASAAERPTFRGVLTVTNGYNSEIQIVRAEWGAGAGRVTVESLVDQLNVVVPGNGSAEVRLDRQFYWKDDAPMNMTEATLTGTLYYRGPKGNVRQIPFNTSGALTIRGD